MIRRLSPSPTGALFGMGALTGVLLLALIPSVALTVLVATLLTAAALAPHVAGAPDLDWAGALLARASTTLARSCPPFTQGSGRDTRLRLFALIAGLNTGVFAGILLPMIGP